VEDTQHKTLDFLWSEISKCDICLLIILHNAAVNMTSRECQITHCPRAA